MISALFLCTLILSASPLGCLAFVLVAIFPSFLHEAMA